MEESRTMPAHSEGETMAGDAVGVFSFLMDPSGAARQLGRKWLWVLPWILLSIVVIVTSYLTLPIAVHVMETAPAPGMDSAAVQARVEATDKFGHIAMYVAPLTTLLLMCVQAGILLLMTSVLTIPATFRQLLNLIAGCSVIQMLSAIATTVILRSKTDIASMVELRPALGLDIFMPEGANKLLVAFLGYFSVFELWWIVMIVLILSAAYRISKGKALTVVSPLIVISLLLRLVGAAFSR